MKSPVGIAAVVGLLVFTACAKRTPSAPPPPPPAAPETPPPAPPPSDRTLPPPVDEYARLRSMPADELDRLGLLHDIHFDFDRSDIRDDAKPVLARNADTLRRYDFVNVTVEGHCDARGTVEYNLALGERRAQAAYDYLVSLGVPRDRLRTVSYGKEAPLCGEPTEECWQRSRRVTPRISGTSRP